MSTIHAIFEDGVFKPTGSVELPERCRVEFEPRLVADDTNRDDGLDAVYEILSRRHASGDSDVAARHDEHQP